jgi:hypothetical protein
LCVSSHLLSHLWANTYALGLFLVKLKGIRHFWVLCYSAENHYLRTFLYQMRSFFQLISNLFRRLFNGGGSVRENSVERGQSEQSERRRLESPQLHRGQLHRDKLHRGQRRQAAGEAFSQPPAQRRDYALESGALDSGALRQLIYQAAYQLPQKKRTHAAQVGALLRAQDRSFSYEKYNFTKLIDLLESVPDLVALEKVDPHPRNPSSAPVYYVRPVLNIRQLLTHALSRYDSPDGWVHLDSVKAAISEQTPSFSTQRCGFSNFTAFVRSRPDLIEFKADSPEYVRLIQPQEPLRSLPKPAKLALKKNALNIKPRNADTPNGTNGAGTNGSASGQSSGQSIGQSGPVLITPEPLSKFANLPIETLNQKVSELAVIALPENWYFGAQPPAEFAHPILKSYLRYTFIRLQHEGKLITSDDNQYCTFNTGLLDTLLHPIYALLTRPSSGLSTRQWNLAFCIAGEGFAGKTLVAHFAELPAAANYLDNPDQAFYHLSAGAPQVDWQHVVKDNMARLPLAFLIRYAPAGFTPRSTQGLTTPEFFDYKRSFVAALDADPASYRNLVRKLEESLERTLKKVQINYKTAVPTYYPKINSIDLLLPMCLVNESTADLALVVRREPSGQYIGHTVLTMRQAYNNARLICKLDEHWLTRSMALSQEDLGEDDDDDEIEDFATDEAASFETRQAGSASQVGSASQSGADD